MHMKDTAIEELLNSEQLPIFALDHYLDARSVFFEVRRELDDARRCLRNSAVAIERRYLCEIMRRYGDAERRFALADIDLQRFHRRMDIARNVVSVGLLARTRNVCGETDFTFVDQSPKADERRRLQELQHGDWLRIWSPERERILLSGRVRSVDGSSVDLEICDRPLHTLTKWFECRFPAEFVAS